GIRDLIVTGVQTCALPISGTASEMMARTRSVVPQTTRAHLRRRRLSEVLDSCTSPLVLLSAPAGSGKTALAAEWAHGIADARSRSEERRVGKECRARGAPV